MASAVDGAAVVIGYLPAGLRPGRLGQQRVPAIERKLNVSHLAALRYATDEHAPEHVKASMKCCGCSE